MSKKPIFYEAFRKTHPRVVEAYEALGDAARAAGPLTPAEAALVKLGMAAGARIPSAVHAHVRRALEAGVSIEAIRHVGILGITTIGWPSAMATRGLIEEELAKQGKV